MQKYIRGHQTRSKYSSIIRERTHEKLSKKLASVNNEEALGKTASPERILTLYEFLEEENRSFPDGDKASPRKREDIFEPLDAHIHKTSCVSPKPPEKDLEEGDKTGLCKAKEPPVHQKTNFVPRPPQDKLKPSVELNETDKSESATQLEQFSPSVHSSLSVEDVFQQRLASWRKDSVLFDAHMVWDEKHLEDG